MIIRKAILTGGGRATRLRPITTTINKHLIPLANKPMIFHAIEKAVEAGVEEIFINTNPGETELQKHIGDGGHWGVKIKFYEQEGGPQGLAHVVKCAEKFIGDEPFMFYLSDNVLLGSLKPLFEKFYNNKTDCLLAFAKVPDPQRFGVPFFDTNGKLMDVVEKPQMPPNDFAVTGLYLYGPKVFFKAFENIEKSARGEYEISSIHSYFLKNDFKVDYEKIDGWWKDTGQPSDLVEANKLILENMTEEEFKTNGQTGDMVGKVHVGAGAIIGKNVKIIGPAIIGENCVLEDCVIGPCVTVGAGGIIKFAKIEHSIILNNCRIESDIKIKDSILGANVRIAQNQNYRRFVLGDHAHLEF
ncbi:MAG: glucose-1-phosphate thymidylyltransferase [Patescibacteria group bacterium]